MQYNIAKHDGTLCENLLNKCFVNYFSGFPLIANGGGNYHVCQCITKAKLA